MCYPLIKEDFIVDVPYLPFPRTIEQLENDSFVFTGIRIKNLEVWVKKRDFILYDTRTQLVIEDHSVSSEPP